MNDLRRFFPPLSMFHPSLALTSLFVLDFIQAKKLDALHQETFTSWWVETLLKFKTIGSVFTQPLTCDRDASHVPKLA